MTKIYNNLAIKLTKQTRHFRDQLIAAETAKNSSSNSHFKTLFLDMQPLLPKNTDFEGFADLYSLTVSAFYLNAAFLSKKTIWCEINSYIIQWFKFNKGSQSREENFSAYRIISSITSKLLPLKLKKLIMEIASEITMQSGPGQTRPNSPPLYFEILPFLEVFLTTYNAGIKKKYGVFFTPYPAVSFMLRMVHGVLRKKLDKKGGVSDWRVTIIDPAAGTSTFMLSAILFMGEVSKINQPDNAVFLLENFCAIERLMPLYILSYLNIAHLARNLKLRLDKNHECRLHWSNALVESENEYACPVIIGNPPFSISSRDGDEGIKKQVKNYFPYNGKNFKWLSADYIKFIRAAQIQIDKKKEGLVCFITNNGYLVNPTFRKMRQSLMETFDRIYILDLHGTAMGTPPAEVEKDENIFSIRQGVCISIFLKKKKSKGKCCVYYSEVWGRREEKFKFLQSETFNSIEWKEVNPEPDYFLFTPPVIKNQSIIHKSDYENFIPVADIFPVHSVGIITARDSLCIQRTPGEMFDTAKRFAGMTEKEARKAFKLRDTRDWSITRAQADLKGLCKEKVVTILYRPFVTRYTYYTGKTRGFICMPRPEVMKHLLLENIALITVRQVVEGAFNHCFITDKICDSRISTSLRGIGYNFPLYLYDIDKGGKQANISKDFVTRIQKALGLTQPPDYEKIFYYIYGILWSPAYRSIFLHRLQTDFPRIPIPFDRESFAEISRLGEVLSTTHLLKEIPVTRLNHNRVFETVQVKFADYEAEKERIYLNANDYIENIPRWMWETKICGYPVLKKWLKGFKGGKLNADHIQQFQQITHALEITRRYQRKIDKIIIL